MPCFTTETLLKFIILSFFTLILIFVMASIVNAEDVILSWYRPNDARVTGYEIFYGPSENDNFKSSPKKIISSPEQTDCDILGLIPGQTYAFAAKSYDQYGNKSIFSEVAFYTVPPGLDKKSNDHENDGTKDESKNGDNINNDNNTIDEDKHSNGSGGGDGGCFIKILFYNLISSSQVIVK